MCFSSAKCAWKFCRAHSARVCRAVVLLLLLFLLAAATYRALDGPPAEPANVSAAVAESLTPLSHPTPAPSAPPTTRIAVVGLNEAYSLLEGHVAATQRNCSRQLVYQCQGGCGGFGDRLRGVITAFYFALLSGRCFALDWRHPVPITHYFNLSAYISPCTPCEVPGARRAHVRQVDAGLDITQLVRHTEPTLSLASNSYLWETLFEDVRFAPVIARHFSYLRGHDAFALAHLALRLLFSAPTPLVSARMLETLPEFARAKGGLFRIGVQVRAAEGRYGADTRAYWHCLRDLLPSLCPVGRECGFFLTADDLYEDWVAELRRAVAPLPLLVAPHRALHLDLSGSAEVRAHVKTFADWLLLREMDSLVISRSGYGETASWVSRAPTARLLTGRNRTVCRVEWEPPASMPAYMAANDY